MTRGTARLALLEHPLPPLLISSVFMQVMRHAEIVSLRAIPPYKTKKLRHVYTLSVITRFEADSAHAQIDISVGMRLHNS